MAKVITDISFLWSDSSSLNFSLEESTPAMFISIWKRHLLSSFLIGKFIFFYFFCIASLFICLRRIHFPDARIIFNKSDSDSNQRFRSTRLEGKYSQATSGLIFVANEKLGVKLKFEHDLDVCNKIPVSTDNAPVIAVIGSELNIKFCSLFFIIFFPLGPIPRLRIH